MTDHVQHTGRSPRRVVVTGASSGIGRATARLFSSVGDSVLATARSERRLADARAGHPTMEILAADLTYPTTHECIASRASRGGTAVDVLVNNAGLTYPARLGEVDPKRAREQLETNLIAPLLLTQEMLRFFAPGAVVVNVSSNPPDRGWPQNSVYGSTKVALDFLTRTWALELAERDVRVVSVAPGPTDTPVLQRAGLSPAQLAAKHDYSRIPLGRPAAPEEIASWIYRLTTEDASFITGAVFRIDGGISIS